MVKNKDARNVVGRPAMGLYYNESRVGDRPGHRSVFAHGDGMAPNAVLGERPRDPYTRGFQRDFRWGTRHAFMAVRGCPPTLSYTQ